jgi:hypothetical protein
VPSPALTVLSSGFRDLEEKQGKHTGGGGGGTKWKTYRGPMLGLPPVPTGVVGLLPSSLPSSAHCTAGPMPSRDSLCHRVRH